MRFLFLCPRDARAEPGKRITFAPGEDGSTGRKLRVRENHPSLAALQWIRWSIGPIFFRHRLGARQEKPKVLGITRLKGRTPEAWHVAVHGPG